MSGELDSEALDQLVARLVESQGVVPLPAALAGRVDVLTRQLGLEATAGGVRIPDSIELLNVPSVLNDLSPDSTRWLEELRVLPSVRSTNSWLRDRAGSQAGLVVTTELQYAGRGRRGRTWLGNFGRNIAVTLGFAVASPPDRLGGLSLMVGLGVRDALADLGVADVGVKWPNDIFLRERKLGGILIELVGIAPSLHALVGIGLNLDIAARRADLDQPAADLASAGYRVSRNTLLARVIDRVVARVGAFERDGFDGCVDEFNRNHVLHRKRCVVLQGDQRTEGLVLGVDSRGALEMDVAGVANRYASGEVSLRRV